MQKIKLGDVLDVKRGASLSGDYYAEKGKYVRLTLGNFNYPGGGFKENTSKSDIYFIGPIKPEFILNEGDIITPLTEQVSGLLGETATIPEKGKYIQSGDIGLVIPDETKLDKRFAYYLIASPMVRKQLDAAAQQTKIRHTSPDAIKACEAWIPEDISVQAFIGKLLDSINKKIANNNAICSDLESMAKLLYDYWFVQFDFPDENGKPYKSSGGKMVWNEELKREIPAGWEVKTLADCTSMYQPKTFDAKLLEQDGKYRVYGAGGYMGQYHEYNHEESEIFISCRGSCGNIYKSMPKSLITGNAMIVHPANTFLREYLYWSLMCYGVHNCITGSVQPQITRDELSKWKVIIPSNSVIESFNIFAIELDMKISAIVGENQQLASLRDFLLPMLMNGQVKIKKGL